MSKAAFSMLVWSIYMGAAGLVFGLLPHLVISIFGFEQIGPLWVRVLGFFFLSMAFYYLVAARNNLVPFFQATVLARILFGLVLIALVVLGFANLFLALGGASDIAGAGWTWWALGADKSSQTFPMGSTNKT